MTFSTIVFDFYGTLAEDDKSGLNLTALLRERGYDLRPDLAREYWQDGLDGTTHDDASQSRDHYLAWQRERLHSLLARCDVPEAVVEELSEQLRRPENRSKMIAYPDADVVLDELRNRGVQIAICSNWDWDLAESVRHSQLDHHFDVLINSAWVGARKPHTRIYEHTLETLEADPSTTLFVGDTWNCDISGPMGHGMHAAYVRRPHRDPDHTRPHGATIDHVYTDLLPLLAL